MANLLADQQPKKVAAPILAAKYKGKSEIYE